MKLINIGFGSMVASGGVLAIVYPDSAPIKRVVQEAKERGMLIDASYGRSTRSVILMDTEKSRFYIKGADGSGMPTLRTFEYTEVTGQNVPQGGSEAVTDLEKRFVTREEFREIMDKNNMLIEAVQKATAALKGKAGEE